MLPNQADRGVSARAETVPGKSIYMAIKPRPPVDLSPERSKAVAAAVSPWIIEQPLREISSPCLLFSVYCANDRAVVPRCRVQTRGNNDVRESARVSSVFKSAKPRLWLIFATFPPSRVR